MIEKNGPALEGGFRTSDEQAVGPRLRELFDRSTDTFERKLDNFPKYVRRQALTKTLVQYEIFKRAQHVKGSIVECGVLRGGSLFTWFHLSAILEPVNFTRRIYGFDTFDGFPSIAPQDHAPASEHVDAGGLQADCYDELLQLIRVHDSNRLLNHIDKVHLIRGDATKSIPSFIDTHPHLVVSLLYLDFDLYEPTCAAIEHFLPRMPRGAIVAFDELDNPLWPGETKAAMERFGLNRLRIERLDFDPYVGFATIE